MNNHTYISIEHHSFDCAAIQGAFNSSDSPREFIVKLNKKYKKEKEELIIDASCYPGNGSILIEEENGFQLSSTEYPGCCGKIVINEMFIGENGRDNIREFYKLVLKLIELESNYTCVSLTHLLDNPIIKALTYQGWWKETDRFKNKRTGNTIVELTIHI